MKESQRQSCKNCGVRDGLSFNVRDSLWIKVLPKRLHNHVVCLSCFDRFAARRKINYWRNITVLYFAGRMASFTFRVRKRSKEKAGLAVE
jgi:hypothetical protein